MNDEHNAPSQSPDSSPSQSTDADRLRALLTRAGLSQRGAARLLNVEERTMRQWCAGQGTPPVSVFRALSPRLTHMENVHRLIEENEMSIKAMQDGRITGSGYSPPLAGPESVTVAIEHLRKLNEQHHALLRVDRAFLRQQEAFLDLNSQSLPHSDGVLTDESMSEARAAQEEFRAAQAELERISREIYSRQR
jgi:transcriptional regulator with XRE-family HTH domain